MKKNSNSCADESATEPTTKPASENLNMSAGAEMLIARMQTNPEDFDYGGKFYRVRSALEQTQDCAGWISPRDFEALLEAYGRLILEGRFSEWVYGEIFNPKEPDVAAQNIYAQAQMQGQKAQIQSQLAQQMRNSAMWNGTVPPQGIYGNAIQNNLSSSPESWTVSVAPPSPPSDPSYIEKLKTKLGL